jgi:hypothetical protein
VFKSPLDRVEGEGREVPETWSRTLLTGRLRAYLILAYEGARRQTRGEAADGGKCLGSCLIGGVESGVGIYERR